jgi:glycogen debranching enzyme
MTAKDIHKTVMVNSKTQKTESQVLMAQARERAERVLGRCSHRTGMKASARASGYPHVWARDSMITLLGGLLSEDKKVVTASRKSLGTLAAKQTKIGLIPNYVDTRTGKPSYHIYADGGAWWVIGRSAVFEVDGNLKSLKDDWHRIKAVLDWYEYQDVDNSGMVSMQEASDWEDLFAVRGKSLTVNVLYYIALKKGASLARKLKHEKESREWSRRATVIKRNINTRLWYAGDPDPEKLYLMYHGPWRSELEKKMFKKTEERLLIPTNSKLPNERYYLPYVTHYDFGEWFDSLGNLLAIISGVADRDQTKDILHIIEDHDLASRGPIAAIYPSIQPGDSDWRDYYGRFNLNQWEFNEWYHGKDGQPMGKEEQAWSAGGYLFAHECVRRGRVPWI